MKANAPHAAGQIGGVSPPPSGSGEGTHLLHFWPFSIAGEVWVRFLGAGLIGACLLFSTWSERMPTRMVMILQTSCKQTIE